MKRRIFAALLAAALGLSLFAGCGTRGEESGDASSASESSGENAGTSESSPASQPTNDEVLADHNAQIQPTDVNLVQFEGIKKGDTVATFQTTMGDIKVKLFPEQAPKAVENFVALAESGYYNGITFHRVISDFMIQAGDPGGDGSGGRSSFSKGEDDPGYFESEYSLDLWHFRGALAMAHLENRPDTNASQFFIVQRTTVDPDRLQRMRDVQAPGKVVDKYEELGGAPHLDWQYTVFGMVMEGMDAVDAIAAVEVDPETSKPLEAVLIETVTVETAAEDIAPRESSSQPADPETEPSGASASSGAESSGSQAAS